MSKVTSDTALSAQAEILPIASLSPARQKARALLSLLSQPTRMNATHTPVFHSKFLVYGHCWDVRDARLHALDIGRCAEMCTDPPLTVKMPAGGRMWDASDTRRILPG